MYHRLASALLITTLAACAPALTFAQGGPGPDLASLSIEDLMHIEITSASRKEQRVADVPSAVFVITNDDIRRSGRTSIPDLLRMVPGVDVAQISPNKWAVSIRGFSGVYANKLLVLVDGRSIYNALFSGVIWDTHELMLDDIDRIEVIRGPGAAMWGANAVNGVINILTKASADTRGGLVRTGGGTSGEEGAARYGGSLGSATYRVFAQWNDRNELLVTPGTGANDASHLFTTGFRTDWGGAARGNAFVVDGNVTGGQAHAVWMNLDPQTAALQPYLPGRSDSLGGFLRARWTHTQPNGASLQVQSYFDAEQRDEPVGNSSRRSVKVDTQYHTALGTRQDVVAGVAFKDIDEDFRGHVGYTLTPSEGGETLLTGFLTDEIALASKRLMITLGTEVQYDSNAGAGVQPTARVMWSGFPHQRLWAATSHALRTPSFADRWLTTEFPSLPKSFGVPPAGGLPIAFSTQGNPAAATETLTDAEAGYRLEIGTTASFDVTGFVGRYGKLQTFEAGAPVFVPFPSPHALLTAVAGNQLQTNSRGIEVAAQWTPLAAWRFDASYSALRLTPNWGTISQASYSAAYDGGAPNAQWQVRSTYSPNARITVAGAVFHVGRLTQELVNCYTRVDLNAEWRVSRRLSVMAIGQNLLDPAHPEGTDPVVFPAQVPRSASIRVRWSSR